MKETLEIFTRIQKEQGESLSNDELATILTQLWEANFQGASVSLEDLTVTFIQNRRKKSAKGGENYVCNLSPNTLRQCLSRSP